MKRSRTPQEKKNLSYTKDRRNTVAEARSASRKAIALRKAQASRALRRAEQVAVVAAGRGDEAEPVVARTGRKSWRKIPDAPLAEYLDRTLRRRVRAGMQPAQAGGAQLRKATQAAKYRKSEFKATLPPDSAE